ncbi:MAG: D-aminoacylase [Candidatus Hadarchaeum sp.]|uniref:N-acyl-D-amino-acid deacylase family protein n=1 Tax=Candidatus Hadarchaeum sp. TaxID=2883567 RepID=UPI003171D7E6
MEKAYDLVVKGGQIIDGLKTPPYRANIGIKKGVIEYIGPSIPTAGLIIDASGCFVCPGFIDMHSHNDLVLLRRPRSIEKIMQGITTETIGHCGFSAAPLTSEWKEFFGPELAGVRVDTWDWESFGEYLEKLSSLELATNIVPFCGYGPIRVAVMGGSYRSPSSQDIAKMQQILEQALAEGAFGLTTGLAYPPQHAASFDELAALCKIVSGYNALYATHVRHNTYNVSKGIQEAIALGATTGAKVHIAHLQVRPRGGCTASDILALMDDARQQGIWCSCDQYPYLAGLGPLSPLLPDWLLSLLGQGKNVAECLSNATAKQWFENWINQTVSTYFSWEEIILLTKSQSIMTMALLEEKLPHEILIDEVSRKGVDQLALYFGKSWDDLREIAKWPYSVIGTDGVFHENPLYLHPRVFNTFPKTIQKFVKELKVLSLEECIFKMTALPAEILGLKDRGAIKLGQKADLVVLDYANLKAPASYINPTIPPQGILYVIVNGHVVKTPDGFVKIKAGEVIRKTRT